MGITHSTVVMVGVEIEDERVIEQVTKYDEDTGEPYLKAHILQYRIVAGKYFTDDYAIRNHFGMDVHDDFVGFVICEISPYSGGEEISDDLITNTKKQVKEKFAQHGMDVEPSLYVIHCAY